MPDVSPNNYLTCYMLTFNILYAAVIEQAALSITQFHILKVRLCMTRPFRDDFKLRNYRIMTNNSFLNSIFLD